MHYHQPEIVCECVCNKVPVARQILKPYLRFWIFIVAINQCQPAVFYFRIDVKSPNVLAEIGFINKYFEFLDIPFFILVFFVLCWIIPRKIWELEVLTFYSFDVTKFIKVHLSKVKNLFVFLNFPIKWQSIWNLQKCLEVIWELIRTVLLLPFLYSDLSHTWWKISKIVLWIELTLSFNKFNISDTDMTFKETDDR